jgi:hypothetical protein
MQNVYCKFDMIRITLQNAVSKAEIDDETHCRATLKASAM